MRMPAGLSPFLSPAQSGMGLSRERTLGDTLRITSVLCITSVLGTEYMYMCVSFEESATCILPGETDLFPFLFNLNLDQSTSTALSDPWLCTSAHLGWRGTQQPWLPALQCVRTYVHMYM